MTHLGMALASTALGFVSYYTQPDMEAFTVALAAISIISIYRLVTFKSKSK